MNDRLLFWIKFAVGLLTVLVMLQIVERAFGLVWAFTSTTESGYAYGTTPSEAVKAALKEALEAIVAIGFAVLVCGWAGLKYLLERYLWRSDERPSPVVPTPDKPKERLRDLLRKLRERIK